MLSGASVHEPDVDEIHRSLEERLGVVVETVNPGAAASFSDRILAAPSFLDTMAPLVGLLVRGKEAA
jgi:hypothetical protein